PPPARPPGWVRPRRARWRGLRTRRAAGHREPLARVRWTLGRLASWLHNPIPIRPRAARGETLQKGGGLRGEARRRPSTQITNSNRLSRGPVYRQRRKPHAAKRALGLGRGPRAGDRGPRASRSRELPVEAAPLP